MSGRFLIFVTGKTKIGRPPLRHDKQAGLCIGWRYFGFKEKEDSANRGCVIYRDK